MLLDAILDATFLEIAIDGACIADRYRRGTPTFAELLGQPAPPSCPPTAEYHEPSVRVRVDRWIVEVIAEFVESRKPSHIRAFVREAVLAHLDRIVVARSSDP